MSDLLALARGLHKQAAQKKETKSTAGSVIGGTAAGLATAVAGGKAWKRGSAALKATGGKKGALAAGLGTGLLYGSIQVGRKVKDAIEKKAAESKPKKDPLRPGIIAGLATMATGTGLNVKGNHQQVRAMKVSNRNIERTYRSDGYTPKKVKGYYENGKYVHKETPNTRAKRLLAVNNKANKLGVAGMKNAKRGGAAVLASPLVGLLVGKAHRMMTEKKDK